MSFARLWLGLVAALALPAIAAAQQAADPLVPLGIPAPFSLSASPPPQAQTQAEESECDQIAALRLPYTSTAEVHNRAPLDWARGVVACTAEVQAHPGDMHLLYQLARAQDHVHDYQPALRNLKVVAEAGYPEALVDLGVMYYLGHGVVQSYAIAFEDFSKAMDAGSNRALVDLAALYANGQGVAKDDVRSLELAERAVEQGNPGGLSIVADHYFNGAGVPRDYRMAAQYLQQAADLGDGRAMKFLANMYEEGYLGASDPAKASELRRRAQQVDPDSPDPMPAKLPPFRQASAPRPQSLMHPRRYVTYRYNPAWQAAPGDTSCCPNNMLVCPLGRHFCGH